KALAQDWGLRCFSPLRLRQPKGSTALEDLMNFIREEKPDLLVVTAYGNLLPQDFRSCTPMGAVNVHASLLPKWRGAAPIQRALENGDLETGVSLQKVVLELDAGDVILEKRTAIAPDENALELSQRLSELGAQILTSFL